MSVGYATANGTALAGSEYNAASGTLNFAAGETTSKTFVVTLIDDTIGGEGIESLALNLMNPTGGATMGASAASLNIADNDAAPAAVSDAGAGSLPANAGGGGGGGCTIAPANASFDFMLLLMLFAGAVRVTGARFRK